MDSCLRDICTGEEETFVYADDAAIITDTLDALQMALNRWREGTLDKGLKNNAQKTEVMHVGRDRIEMQVNIGDVRLKQVDTFSYLGVSTNEENKQDIEIDRRIAKYNANVSALFPLLKDKHVPTPAKVLKFTTILRPILLYGSENWSLTTKTASRVQAAEMRTLRMIRGVTRTDLMRNERIKEDLGVEATLNIIERSKLRLYGHVKRMDTERHARKYLDWNPNSRRPVGRPRKRWLDGVDHSLNKRGLSLAEVEEEEEVYLNREAWREIVHRSLD